MYFENFPLTYYSCYDDLSNVKIVTNITNRVKISEEAKNKLALFDEYDIRDGETPELIAERVYGSSQYHWVVMLCNEKYNYIDDFPLSIYNLEKHIDNKYGANKYATHHYEDANGYIIDGSQAGAQSVSNYDYEFALNETKRRIKLISPSLLNTILKNFKDLI